MILASQSPRRIELMQEAGYAFRVLPASIDEGRRENESPKDLVARLSREKAEAVVSHASPYEVVIGSDTVVVLGDRVLGKPRDASDARAMLALLSGSTHEVMTAVTMLFRDEHGSVTSHTFTDVTRVTFYPISDAAIDLYVATGEPFDKAGAYAIQGTGRFFIESVAGAYETVVGLPIGRLMRELPRFLAGGRDDSARPV